MEYVIYQMDEFTPAFEIATFDTEEEAKDELRKIEKESALHDMFTCFQVVKKIVKKKKPKKDKTMNRIRVEDGAIVLSLNTYGTTSTLRFSIEGSTIKQGCIEDAHSPIDDNFKENFKNLLKRHLKSIIEEDIELKESSVGISLYKDGKLPQDYELLLGDTVVEFHIVFDKEKGLQFVISDKEKVYDIIAKLVNKLNKLRAKQGHPLHTLITP